MGAPMTRPSVPDVEPAALPDVGRQSCLHGPRAGRGGQSFYYRGRYFDSGSGRFISADPIGLGGGLNCYRYVNNGPNGAIDPFGLELEQVTLNGLGQTYLDSAMARIVDTFVNVSRGFGVEPHHAALL